MNECEEVNDCQQICENTVGSYICSCNEGFTLADDNRTCIGMIICVIRWSIKRGAIIIILCKNKHAANVRYGS